MKKIVIVGAGHAAGQVAASLRQKKFAGKITLLGDESWFPYQRPPLSKRFLAGELPAERLFVKPPSFYAQANIDVELNTLVTSIDRDEHAVSTAAGNKYSYDDLIIATGSRPRKISLSAKPLAGVHYLRGIDDVENIKASFSAGCRVVIIGAGYIGLEVAAVATQLGHSVTVVEMADRVMSRVVSAEISNFYQDIHTKHGVRLLLSTGIRHLTGNGSVSGIALESGEWEPADVVIVGIGIVPNIELAADAGIEVNNGIVVDDHCRTSDANIYAVGDCTWHPNSILGIETRLESVHNALEQAKTAAQNICGEDTAYAQVPWFWSDQYDLKLQIAGLSNGYDQVVIRGDMTDNAFSCLYLLDGCLIAIDAINRPKDFVQSKALIAGKARIDATRLADTSIDLKDM